MENKSSIWLNLTGIICYFMGISCVTTLILIPVAIYCFIGGNKYFTWSNLSDIELYNQRRSLRNWAIFVSIIAFPIGLISIIPFINAGSRPVISSVEEKTEENKTSSEEKAEEMGIKVEEQTIKAKEHVNAVSTKEETIKKLEKFRDDGLITKQEFDRAVKELNNEER